MQIDVCQVEKVSVALNKRSAMHPAFCCYILYEGQIIIIQQEIAIV